MCKNVKRFFYKKGFTLLELVLVFSVLAIIAAAGSGFYSNYSKGVEINTSAQTISEDLRQIQSKSMTGNSGLKWGAHFVNGASNYYELFSTPTDYSDGSKSITATNYLPNGVTFTDPGASSTKDIIFNIITGATTTSSVTISSNGGTQTISVSSIGTVSYGNSYGNTVTGITYNITAISGSNGSISPSGTTAVASGGSQVYSITPVTGYTVATLTVDGAYVSPTTSYTFSNVGATHTISATFSILTYTITATQGSNGTISPSGVTTKNYGDSQAYTITPSTGYYISAITVDGSGVGTSSPYTFSNITANHTITATFTIYTYTITVNQGSNGTISPGTTTKNYGTSQAFTITPNSGYSISAITVDGSGVGTSSPYTFSNITTNHTITATYVSNTVAILVIGGGGGGGVYGGGGGSAGNVIYNAAYTIPVGSYAVTIGQGGYTGSYPYPLTNGTDTSLGSLLSAAGNSTGAAQFGNGGGGSGCGGAGAAWNGTNAAGGPGCTYSISGSPVVYAKGGSTQLTVTTPAANSGSGHDTDSNQAPPSTGAAGVIIISYPTGSITATGGTITTVGGNTIHTFNSNGTFTRSS